MVGTTRSNGCGICRKRKKKCGEERPECLACLRAGWRCPGYVRRWRFVDERQGILRQYRRKQYLFEETSVTTRPLSTPPFAEIIWPLNSPCDRISARLVYVLEDRQSQAIFPLTSHGKFYACIPSRLGEVVALDSAVSCLCDIYVAKLMGSALASPRVIQSYVRSLQAFHALLDTPATRLDPVTLCSSIVLQSCELLIDRGLGRWPQLLHGSKYLIQERGPERFRTPFEFSMLESQKGFILIQDIIMCRPCFLAQPKWRLLAEEIVSPQTSDTPCRPDLRGRLCAQAIDAPDLLFEGLSLLNPAFGTAPDDFSDGLATISARILTVQGCVESWLLTELMQNGPQNGPPTHPRFDYTYSQSQPMNSIHYPDILPIIIVFLANLVLIQLEKTHSNLLALKQFRHMKGPGSRPSPAASLRRVTMGSALASIKGYSEVAAKPLEFDLEQLEFANPLGVA